MADELHTFQNKIFRLHSELLMRKEKKWDELRYEYKLKKDAISQKLLEFRAVSSENYFYELVFCLLTPQSSALHAYAVQKKLEKLNYKGKYFNPESILRDKEHYIRFHKVKSRYLLALLTNFAEADTALKRIKAPFELREWLVKNILGFGYKEATHFLRNIGKNEDMAIFDRHILKNLQEYIDVGQSTKSLTRKQYLALEEKFQHFADTIGISVNELDLLFWSRETGMMLK